MEDIEIRSEKVEEILSYVPHWIIRMGIAMIFIVICIILIICWFIKYPEIITAPILITTAQPPANILARTTGKIQKIFIKDNQNVKKDEVLAIIENSADFDDILKIKTKLYSRSGDINEYSIQNYYFFMYEFTLGELQSAYSAFKTALINYKYLLTINYHNKKINLLKEQLATYKIIYDQNQSQKILSEKEYDLNKKQYERDSLLALKKLISSKDFENTKSTVFQKEANYQSAKSNLSGIQLQIQQLKQSIVDLELDREIQVKQLQTSLDKSVQELLSQISIWEQKYILKSPIEGMATFTNYWSINQNVASGEVVMTIVPDKNGKIIGKVKMPIAGSGKVKIDQKVLVKLDNFPYQEFGTLRGIVKQISKVTSLNTYYVLEIEFPDRLITTYGKHIDFDSELNGTSDIITEDIRLIERFINPIKSLMKNDSY
jgi:multidrug resistance efflux pump